jgi:hypothetical protein
MDKTEAITVLNQIGKMTVWAISGGRWMLDGETLVLPSGKGYSVEIDLTPADDYTVRRVYKRGVKKWVKGEKVGIYCDQISDTAYAASCYVNVDF